MACGACRQKYVRQAQSQTARQVSTTLYRKQKKVTPAASKPEGNGNNQKEAELAKENE